MTRPGRSSQLAGTMRPALMRQTGRITLTGAADRLAEQAHLHGGDHRLGLVRDPQLE